MARKKRGGKPKTRQALDPKTKRYHREKVRRQRQVRAMGVGFKERFISGCIAFGLVGLLLLIGGLTWQCLTRPS